MTPGDLWLIDKAIRILVVVVCAVIGIRILLGYDEEKDDEERRGGR